MIYRITVDMVTALSEDVWDGVVQTTRFSDKAHPFLPALPGHEVFLSHFVQHLANTFRSHVPLPNPACSWRIHHYFPQKLGPPNFSNQEPWFSGPESSYQLNANEQRFQLATSRNMYSQLKVKGDQSTPCTQSTLDHFNHRRLSHGICFVGSWNHNTIVLHHPAFPQPFSQGAPAIQNVQSSNPHLLASLFCLYPHVDQGPGL